MPWARPIYQRPPPPPPLSSLVSCQRPCTAPCVPGLLLFHAKYSFFSLPVGNTDPTTRLDWTKHSLPRAASFVRAEGHPRIPRARPRLDRSRPVTGVPPRCPSSEQVRPNAARRQPPGCHRVRPVALRPTSGRRTAGDRLLLVLFMLGQWGQNWAMHFRRRRE
ncbi:hypothetical protein GUJ93_ZPchr0006g42190 [Zizania palustris]|uniref:Uncharacterized protein n=1 Tax=Zizania palustris TaxID=103762 RepID=A0A8J5SGR0_ZIZPA|nr:hypothetical protein GUJ93_ZPchr0006g42190 [Zizania palustris]